MRTSAKVVAGRIGLLFVSLAVASVAVFLLINLLPGDVAAVIMGTNADPSSVEQVRAQLGLDRPLLLRYFEWIGQLLSGNLPSSVFTGMPIGPQVARRLGVTFSLVGLGMLTALLIALPAGMLAAAKRNKTIGVVVSVISQLGMAIPAFLAGLILVIIFAVKLRWLPANGYVPLKENPGQWIRYLILPVCSIAAVQGAILTRYVRSAFVEVIKQDYFRTARAVGFPYTAAMIRHGLRNAALQVLTVLGLQLSTLLVGAIVVEQVFRLPGLGSYLVQSVAQRDLPVVQTLVMILVTLVLVINTIVDLAYQLIDPRLREDGEDS
uniref:ABC transporter permease n=1 Tax=Vaginimicrobium propionicum TaxID=1871034 RepID=UPI0009704540|nr:ABC transporter permease [Vaginimicrobium propionicum]